MKSIKIKKIDKQKIERKDADSRKERKPTRCGRVRGHKRVIERLIGERRGKEREDWMEENKVCAIYT